MATDLCHGAATGTGSGLDKPLAVPDIPPMDRTTCTLATEHSFGTCGLGAVMAAAGARWMTGEGLVPAHRTQ